MIKKIFSKYLLWRLWAPLILGIFLIILDRSIPNINIFVIFVKFLRNILIQNIPIYIILILIVLAYILFILIQRKLNEGHYLLLSLLNNREVGLTKIFFAYQRFFPNNSRVISNSSKIISKLEKLKLIEMGSQTGGINQIQDEYFKISKKGKKRLNKVKKEIETKANQIFEEVYSKQFEQSLEHENILPKEVSNGMLFILNMLAQKTDKRMMKNYLRNSYLEEYSEKDVSDFNYVWSILEKKEYILIEQFWSSGYDAETPFYITDAGLEYIKSWQRQKNS